MGEGIRITREGRQRRCRLVAMQGMQVAATDARLRDLEDQPTGLGIGDGVLLDLEGLAVRFDDDAAGDCGVPPIGHQAIKFVVYPSLISASLKPSKSLKT